MSISDILARGAGWYAGLATWKQVLLAIATTAFVVELILRNVAPKSKVYAGWTRGLEAVGHFWTSIILSIVYFGSVSFVGIGMRLLGKDPLDRQLASEPSFWRSHEPNPLGPLAASRHQF